MAHETCHLLRLFFHPSFSLSSRCVIVVVIPVFVSSRRWLKHNRLVFKKERKKHTGAGASVVELT